MSDRFAFTADTTPTLRRRSVSRQMQCDFDLPEQIIEQLWYDPHLLLASGQILQEKPRCTVVRIEHPYGTFLFKHHNWGGPIRTVKKTLRRAPAKQSWLDGRYLHSAGVPTPRPRAFVDCRLGPLGMNSFLLTDYVPGTTLYRLMRFDRPTPETVSGIAQQVAAIWQQLGDLHVSHNDLKTENFMIDRSGRVWLIDLEKMRRHRRPAEVRSRQNQDAMRLFHPRNWRADPSAAEVFRQQIVQTPATAELLASDDSGSHPLVAPVATENDASQLVTVLIPTHNNADVVAECVQSVRDIADEILIADAGSSDNTLEVVRSIGDCKIIEHPGADELDLANWGHRQASHPWVLRVLPNERVSAELAKEVQDLLVKEPRYDGFNITLRYFFWGRLVKFGGFRNRASLRLYRRDSAHYTLQKGRPEAVVASQNVGSMDSKILYETCWSVEQYIHEMTRVATRTADHARKDGLHPQCRTVLWRAPWRFFKSYCLQLGFLDGWAGFHASWLSALAVYLREAKLWEADKALPPRQWVTPESLHALKLFVPETAESEPPISLPFVAEHRDTSAANSTTVRRAAA